MQPTMNEKLAALQKQIDQLNIAVSKLTQVVWRVQVMGTFLYSETHPADFSVAPSHLRANKLGVNTKVGQVLLSGFPKIGPDDLYNQVLSVTPNL